MIRFRIWHVLLFLGQSAIAEDAASSGDLKASASEFRGPKYLPPDIQVHHSSRGCNDCNSVPWIPMVGRSLHFPVPSSHTPYFKEKAKPLQNNFRGPPIDHYGAPQGSFNFPSTGEVVDFMLPPPFIKGDAHVGISNGLDLNPPPLHQKPYFTLPSFGSSINKPIPTTYLRPVAQNYHPPGGGIHTLPLENNLPPAMPSDSYGRPLNSQYEDPISLGSGESEVGGLVYKGLTQVQVVPSLRIADYTASIEHPINLIQSPILDLQVNEPEDKASSVTSSEESKLSVNPIVVDDDAYTSASNINSTYATDDVLTKRHNDKFLASGSGISKETDLTSSLIQKLLLEHNIIADPKSQIVGIQKSVVNPNELPKTNFKLAEPWTPSTVMLPPRSTRTQSTWMTPVTDTAAKSTTKLQIIVPYMKSSPPIYNKEYTTLAPVFVPPAITTQNSNLWTQLMNDIRTVETQREAAQGFAKSTTEVYNINDFYSKERKLFDTIQRNIDKWTQQSYSVPTTRMVNVKHISGKYVSTESPIITQSYENDHLALGSEHKDIEENLVLPETTTTTTTKKPSVFFKIRKSKPNWEDSKVVLRNSTHEKVYVVTPHSYMNVQSTSTPATAFSMAPKIQNGQVNNATTITKISVRVESDQSDAARKLKPIKVIYSEWPHLINDLQTTTSTLRPTSRHPLFGLMDAAAFTSPPNSTVVTIGGHSKVTNIGTSSFSKFTTTTPIPYINDTVKVVATR